jgi:hypothetical protein
MDTTDKMPTKSERVAINIAVVSSTNLSHGFVMVMPLFFFLSIQAVLLCWVLSMVRNQHCLFRPGARLEICRDGFLPYTVLGL